MNVRDTANTTAFKTGRAIASATATPTTDLDADASDHNLLDADKYLALPSVQRAVTVTASIAKAR